MPDEIYNEFERDLAQYEKTLSGLDRASQFCAFTPQNIDGLEETESSFVVAANQANEALRDAQAGLPVLRGAMFAQSISRFEIYVKNQIEDLVVRASFNAQKFSHLSRELRENAVVQSALVLGNPKKFRMERFVSTIARTMAQNITDESAPGVINQYCISLTSENMRASTLDELFRRIGISDAWSRIGTSTDVQILLQQPDASQASTVSQKRLNTAIERRNQIIHPSTGITWPSRDEVADLINLLVGLGKAISSNIPIFEMRLKEKSDAAAGGATTATAG